MAHVSVVIPLYDTQRYIAETLASVLAQTYRDFEVIVVDDGSHDAGPEIARTTSDTRVRVVTQANRGLAGARNTGIREARGEVIAFLDADDSWTPTKLERHVELLASRPNVGVTFSASALVDDDGHPLGMTQRPPVRADYPASYVFCRNPVGNGSAPVIRRATLDAIAFHDAKLDRICWFDESFRQSEDIECWTRIAALTPWQFALIDEPMTLYRVNTSGLSANTGKQLETWRRFRAKVKSYAPALEAAYGDTAEAYQLRYLARRAVRGASAAAGTPAAQSTGTPALDMILRAIRLQPRLLWEEPSRTSVTLAAALAQRALPQTWFNRCEQIAMTGLSHLSGVRI